jgi:acetyl-CoA C-acetyltransferase
LTPDAWLTAVTTVALDPSRMGMGPAIAIPKLLESTGLADDDIDLYEINEAFAAQILAVNAKLNIASDKLNVNGGAIALGHPLGASGMRLVVTLVHALRKRGLQRGVVSLCIGGGQGMAALIERA